MTRAKSLILTLIGGAPGQLAGKFVGVLLAEGVLVVAGVFVGLDVVDGLIVEVEVGFGVGVM